MLGNTESRRPLADIIHDLSQPIPEHLLGSKKKGGNVLTFIPWYRVIRLLDQYAPGWSYQIHSVTPLRDQVVMVVSITIPAAEGDITRFASGIEEEEVSGYGDTSSNAESMALRRAAAKFGCGLYLYDKSQKHPQAQQRQSSQPQASDYKHLLWSALRSAHTEGKLSLSDRDGLKAFAEYCETAGVDPDRARMFAVGATALDGDEVTTNWQEAEAALKARPK